MNIKTLWGEPLALIAATEAGLAFVLTLTTLSTQTQGSIMTAAVAVGGLWGAWGTQDTMLGAATTVVKALGAAAVTFGANWTDTQQQAAIGALAVVVGLFYHRQQTSPAVSAAPVPLAAPIFSSTITATTPPLRGAAKRSHAKKQAETPPA